MCSLPCSIPVRSNERYINALNAYTGRIESDKQSHDNHLLSYDSPFFQRQ